MKGEVKEICSLVKLGCKRCVMYPFLGESNVLVH